MTPYERLKACVSAIRNKTDFVPSTALVLGSGLGAFGEKIRLEADEKALDWLAANGFDEKLGARPMERLIRDAVTAKVVDDILFGSLKKGGSVKISADDSGLLIRKKS